MSDLNQQPPNMGEATIQRAHALVWAKRRCETCDHFEPQQSGDSSIGFCTYNPPTPMAGMGPNPQALLNSNAPPMIPQLQGVFPPTHKTRKCGKWTPRIQGSA